MLESSNSILRVKLHTALIIEALKKKARGATELAGVKKKSEVSAPYITHCLLRNNSSEIIYTSMGRLSKGKRQKKERNLMSKY